MFQVIHPPYKKITLACIACLCFETGVCPWPDLSSLFQYTSPTRVVSLHLIPRIQYHPGIPVTLLTGSSSSRYAGFTIRGPSSSCEMIIFHNNSYSVCMRIFTIALKNKTIRQILNKNTSPYFHRVSLVIWPFTLMKRTHFNQLSISRFFIRRSPGWINISK